MPQIGIITHDHREEVFGLFGQRRFPHHAQYEYYFEPIKGGGGRVPLCTPRGELWSGDGVELPGYKGVWQVTLFAPRGTYPSGTCPC